MAHLKKDANGHLWKNTAGHLVNECPEHTWVPGQNTCNACSPALPDTMYVTGSGFAGNFARACWGDSAFNGTMQVDWRFGCDWAWGCPGRQAWIELDWNKFGTAKWGITLGQKIGCSIKFEGPATPCDPFGLYTYYGCVGWACSMGDSCVDSEDASVSVDWK